VTLSLTLNHIDLNPNPDELTAKCHNHQVWSS